MASLQKNVASQNLTFVMVNAANGLGLASATVTGFVTKDAATQVGIAGTVTSMGNGQYNYTPTQAETNATDVGFLFTCTSTNAVPVNMDFHTDVVDVNSLLKVDLEDIAGVAVSTASAQLGVNVVSVAGAASNIKKNQALNNFAFIMTDSTNHNPSTGLTVTATRSIDGAAFGSCANSVVEIANGWYKINLAASDLNGTVIALRFTATNNDDRDIMIITQP